MSSRTFIACAIIAFGSAAGAATGLFETDAPASPGSTEFLARSAGVAADAVRRGDCAAAAAVVEAQPALTAPERRLILGLQAHACGDDASAVGQLGATTGGELEDWRLFVLADAYVRAEAPDEALKAFHALLRDHPGSPLAPEALLRAATIAAEGGELEAALALVERGQLMPPQNPTRRALDRLGWAWSEELGDDDRRRQAARRLLIHDPLEASELQVIEALRPAVGDLDWSEILTSDELEDRARSLLAVKLYPAALAALDAAVPGDRDLPWALLRAEILTADHRGAAAYRELSELRGGPPPGILELEWARALAASDAARVRRGRTNLDQVEREEMRDRARQHLWRVVQTGGGNPTALAALGRLYADLVDEELFDQAIDVLRRLRRLSPSDTTGMRELWRRGWSEYQRRNDSGAIGNWSELQDLYPETSFARSGRYWSARAYERLGNGARAHELYLHLTEADATDFYRKYALARLGEAGAGEPASSGGGPTEPWPLDRRLERARLLSDLGLDSVALQELDLLQPDAEPRAWNGLRAVILARSGERRESIRHLRRTFPALGGPRQASVPPEALRMYYPLDFAAAVRRHAGSVGLAPQMVMGMIRQESAFDATATSWAGARGLMQLMPATAREQAGRLGLRYSSDRLQDPDFSIRVGTAYFGRVMAMFGGTEELALAGYNGGPYRIKRLWRTHQDGELDRFLEGLEIEETKTYVKRVMHFSDSYRRLYPDSI